MGCVSPREQEDVDVQSKEIQLQIFLCSIDNIRNGFFYLNEGESITQQHLISGFQNMQNIVLALITKYTGADELLKKFIQPFKQPDGTYEFRNILICFYLNAREKSCDKAKGIVKLLYQDKTELSRSEVRNIFQRIFRSVIAYSSALMDRYLVPKLKDKEEEKKDENDEKVQELNVEENDEKKEEQLQQQNDIQNKQYQQEQKEKEKENVKAENNEEIQGNKKQKKARKFKKKIIEKILNKEIETYLDFGKKMANKITKTLMSTPEQTMTVEEFAEQCENVIPEKFGKDVMYPRGVRLLTYELHDKTTFKR